MHQVRFLVPSNNGEVNICLANTSTNQTKIAQHLPKVLQRWPAALRTSRVVARDWVLVTPAFSNLRGRQNRGGRKNTCSLTGGCKGGGTGSHGPTSFWRLGPSQIQFGRGPFFKISAGPTSVKNLTTLESLISVPLVIRVPQPHGGVKIMLYDMPIEIRLS